MLNENCSLFLTSKDSLGRDIYTFFTDFFFPLVWVEIEKEWPIEAACKLQWLNLFVLHWDVPKTRVNDSTCICHSFPFSLLHLLLYFSAGDSFGIWLYFPIFISQIPPNLILCAWWYIIFVDWSQYFFHCPNVWPLSATLAFWGSLGNYTRI